MNYRSTLPVSLQWKVKVTMVDKDIYRKTRERMIAKSKAEQKKYYIICAVLTILALVSACVGGIYGLVLFGLPATICFIIALQEKQRSEDLQTEIDTMDTRDLEAEQREAELNLRIAMRKNEQKRAAEHPHCPTCHSTNTRRVTNAARAASVATLGLASSKIGKNFECLNCKYKW